MFIILVNISSQSTINILYSSDLRINESKFTLTNLLGKKYHKSQEFAPLPELNVTVLVRPGVRSLDAMHC